MKALLVIDMLNDFIAEDGVLTTGAAGREIIGFIKERIAEFRAQGAPVIFICDHHEQDDKEFEMFPAHCLAGSPGSQIIAELEVQPRDKIITKRRYSAFFGTELDLYLREKGVEELYLVGVCTNICVLYTAADARNLGYRVHIYAQGVASFDEQAHHFALKEAQQVLGCTIL
ncbi:MAG TPA: isochorismatase family cysteine hydrolase [Limnochordia bacterium]|nr:isochorismatase family cysteine hydrolase [Limnochordia bacterium]